MAAVTNIGTALLLAVICLAVTYVGGAPLAEDDPVKPNYRLTDKVTPSHYVIELTPHPTEDGDFDSFDGSVLINVDISEPIKEFHIHVGELMKIEKIQLLPDVPNEEVQYDKDFGSENEGYEDNELYIIKFVSGNDIENTIKQIKIEFNSEFPTGMYGFYKSYYTENGKESVLLTTQFQPTHARKAFPCFDEPKFKATFQLTINVPDGYNAISNTEKQEDPTRENEVKFKETPIMSTYLLAFIVYDETSYSKLEDKHFSTWGRASEIRKGELSQKYGPEILTAMGEYTGIQYYLNDIETTNKPTKVDQAAIPDFSAGAMENWGLVTYRETALLYDEKRHSEVAKKRIVEVIAHELAHQWFGNLVTTGWWDSTWLNEGFATFFEYYLTKEVIKDEDWRMDERFVVDEQLRALSADAVTSAPPLTKEVTYPSEVSGHFGTISYSKGGSILRMFENILEDKFKENLQKYLKKYALKPVIPDNLFDELIEGYVGDDEVNKDKLKSILSDWTTKNGFPLISAVKNDDNINITQKRFLLTDDDDDNTEYGIRVNLKIHDDTKSETNAIWLLESEKKFSIEERNVRWFLVEPTGYFRVQYDTNNWKALIEELEGKPTEYDTISQLERAVLIDDSLNLARAGKLKYSTAIELLSYLKDEDDFIPWSAASIGLNFLHRMLVKSKKNGNIIEGFIFSIVENVYTKLEDEDDKDHIKKVHHANIFNWACKTGHKECLSKAEEEFDSHVKDEDDVNVDIRNTVYCYGVKNNETAWIHLWNKLIQEEDAVERSVIISGLGCSSNELVLYMYLESAVANNIIRPQDIASVFSSVYSNPDGVEIALRFLELRMSAVADTTETVMNGMTNIINGISSYLTTEEQKTRLKNLKENEIKESIKDAIDKAISSVETNLQWLNNYEDDVLEAMSPEPPTTESTSSEPTTESTSSEPTTESTSSEPTTESTSSEPTTESTSSEPTTTTGPSTTPDGASQIFPTILVLITAFITIVCL